MTETTTITAAEHDAISHALGLGRQAIAYRNYFCAGSEDETLWRGLVAKGFASGGDNEPSEVMPYPVFRVTRAGIEAAGLGRYVPKHLIHS